MPDPLIEKLEVDVSTQKREENHRIGPKFHITHNEEMKAIPLIHADSLQISVDVQSDSITKVLQSAFVSIQLLSGDAGLYIAADPEMCERIGKDLLANAKILRKTLKTGKSLGKTHVRIDAPEDPRELL